MSRGISRRKNATGAVLAQKNQAVRLLDIFALGPFMIWFGATSDHPFWVRALMIASGGATITYNLRNYLANRQASPSRRVMIGRGRR